MSYRATLRTVFICALVIMCSLALIGCGDSTPDADPDPSPQQPSDTDPDPAGPSRGGHITIPIVDDPIFNPHHPRHYVESVMVTRIMFPGLTQPGDDMTPSPALAESWDVSDDGLEWTFYIRPNANWHDGTPVTGEDVRFTFMDVVLDPEQGSSIMGNFAMVEDVVVLDDKTVQFHLSSPSASLTACLGYNAGIVPKHILDGVDINSYDEFNKNNPIGSGPFKLEEYVSGQHVRLVRNDDFYGDEPYLDYIHYKILPDPNTQVAQMLSKDIDLMVVENPANLPRLEGEDHIRIENTPQVNYFFLAPNTTIPGLQERAVRQAMMYAWDRDAMITSIIHDFGSKATGPISPALSYYYNPDVKDYSFDPDQARELLDEAGWVPGADGVRVKDGVRLAFTITVPRVQVHEQIGTLTQQYFNDVGFDITLETLEFNTFIADRLVPRSYDILGGWWVSPPDPDVYNYFHSSAAATGSNVPMFADDDLDELLRQGRETSDPDQRQEIYFEIQTVLAEEVPYLFLWYPEEITAMNRRLGGMPPIAFRDALQHSERFYVVD